MHLTRYTDYALRTLMYLALKGDGLATIQEIADRHGISNNHLMKVVYELGRAGYITTVRGKGGGLRLAKDPARINLGEVVRYTEPDMNIVECFGTGSTCRLTSACVLKTAFTKGLKAFLAELDKYTLADLVAPERELAALLALPSPRHARAAAGGARGRP